MTSDERQGWEADDGTWLDDRMKGNFKIEEEHGKGLFETLLELLEGSGMVPDGVDGHAMAESARRMREEPILMRAMSLGKVWVYVTQMTDMADRLRLELMDPDLMTRKKELDDDLMRTLTRYMKLMWEQNNRLAERHLFETEDWFKKGMEDRR